MKLVDSEVCQSVRQSSRLQSRLQHVIRVVLTLLFLLPPVLHAQANQNDFSRKVITRKVPEYPSLARSLRLGGIVKLDTIVAANGTQKSVVVRGGPPILCAAAVTAVRQWKWMSASHETTEFVEVTFQPD
jgi:hypothetical protein